MSDIANIHILENDAGGVYLRTSKDGDSLPWILADALDHNNREYWNDPTLLSRAIFCEMIAQRTRCLWISSKVNSGECIITVNCYHKTVWLGSRSWSFDDFIELRPRWEK